MRYNLERHQAADAKQPPGIRVGYAPDWGYFLQESTPENVYGARLSEFYLDPEDLPSGGDSEAYS